MHWVYINGQGNNVMLYELSTMQQDSYDQQGSPHK